MSTSIPRWCWACVMLAIVVITLIGIVFGSRWSDPQEEATETYDPANAPFDFSLFNTQRRKVQGVEVTAWTFGCAFGPEEFMTGGVRVAGEDVNSPFQAEVCSTVFTYPDGARMSERRISPDFRLVKRGDWGWEASPVALVSLNPAQGVRSPGAYTVNISVLIPGLPAIEVEGVYFEARKRGGAQLHPKLLEKARYPSLELPRVEMVRAPRRIVQ
jgi:hypothetical protein